jgi:hypothetical protein
MTQNSDERERLDGLLRERVFPRYRTLLGAVQGHIGGRVAGRFAFDRIQSGIHGLSHWTRVGCLALRIVNDLPLDGRPRSVDEEAVLLAAFFHDSGRIGEGTEPGHGEAGATILEALAGGMRLDPATVAVAARAIRLHESKQSPLPTADRVAIALANGDRVDRVRLGETPIPERMYDDGIWPALVIPSNWLLRTVDQRRTWDELGDVLGTVTKRKG